MDTLRVRWASGEASFEPGAVVRAGRSPDVDVYTENSNVSRHHAEIAYTPSGWVLRDTGSAQGTWRDGRRVDQLEVRGTVRVTLGREGRGEVLTLEASPGGRADRQASGAVVPLVAATEVVPDPAPSGRNIAGDGGTVVVGDSGQLRPGGALRAEALEGATVVTGDSLNVDCAGRSYTFQPGVEVSIGRDAGCDVVTSNPTVSRRHARLRHDGTQWLLVDDGSAGGTFVDGERVTSLPLSGSVAAWLGDPTTGERVVIVARGVNAGRGGSRRVRRRNLLLAGAGALLVLVLAGVVLLGGGGSGPSNDELGRATVRIVAPDRTGSGTIIDAEAGLILTNAHVVAPSAPGSAVRDRSPAEILADNPREVEIFVAPALGRAAEPRFVAEVVAVDGYADLAVLRITKTLVGRLVEAGSEDLDGLVDVEIGDSSEIETGDDIKVFGYPSAAQSANVTLVDGLVSGAVVDERMGSNQAMFNISAQISGGSSGGLAVNHDGELIGVPSLVRDETVGSMRPSEFALPLIEAARNGEDYESPYIRPLEDETVSNVRVVDPPFDPGIGFRCESAGITSAVSGVVGVSFDFEGFEVGEHQDVMALVFANDSLVGIATLELEWPVSWPAESGCATIAVPVDDVPAGEVTFSAALRIGPGYRAPT